MEVGDLAVELRRRGHHVLLQLEALRTTTGVAYGVDVRLSVVPPDGTKYSVG